MITQRLRAPVISIWLLQLLSFSAPGRTGPSGLGGLDVIALAKLGVRLLTLILLGSLILNTWNHPRRRLFRSCMIPMGAFLAWSILSVLWSPLKAITLGQAGGLMVQLLLMFSIAMIAENPRSRETIIYHLTLSLMTMSTVVLLVHIVSPDISGLSRGSSGEGSLGIIHPTSAGATAGLGFLGLLTIRLLWNWQWVRPLLAPGLLIHGAMLWLAMSRTALVITLCCALMVWTVCVSRKLLAQMVLLICSLGTTFLLIDPGGRMLDDAFDNTSQAVTRGESAESLRSLTGRQVLWEAIIKSYTESPIIGHGYFVTAKDGLLDVWGGPANRTAHNLLLQVLVSTGIVGLLLFFWSVWRALKIVVPVCWTQSSVGPLPIFLGCFGAWYLGWSQLCASFLGPVQPESVHFFSLLGVAMSLVGVSSETEECGQEDTE